MSIMYRKTRKKQERQSRQGESGNVLFLILIAVALFAALSYAVMQSSRSGGGDASSETNLINSAQITQYPASIRTAIIRMVVSQNVDQTTLQFDKPSGFAADCNANPSECVFHPSGGGANYGDAPGNIMANGSPGTWYFNGNFDIVNIGTSGAGGNDIIAFLPGIKTALCTKINDELGITGDVTDDFTDASYVDNMENADTLPTTDQEDIGDADAAGLAGQPFGCMIDSSSSTNIYYHVLVER